MTSPMEGVVEFVRENLPKLNPYQEIRLSWRPDGYLAEIVESVKGCPFPSGIKWEKESQQSQTEE